MTRMPRTNQISAIALGISLAPWISMGQSLLGQSANDSPTSGSGAIVASNGQGGGAESAVASGGAESGPQVVALVNGLPIPRERLAEECLRRHGAMVLDDLLDKMLVLQACQAQNLVITKEDVNDEIARQATKFKLNTKMFLQLLEEERGVKPERYAADIVWPMLAMRQLARDKIQVTQEEIDRAYQYEFGPSVKVRMIAVKDEEKAKQIHQQVAMDPSEFKRLAKQESTDQSSASVEGLLPPIRKNSGDDLIEHMAFQLKPDEVSEIFQVANQYVILQCVRHEPATPPHPDQMDATIARIRQTLEERQLEAMASTMFTTLRSQSQVVKVYGEPSQAQHPGVAAFINQQPIPLATLANECLQRFGTQVLEGEIHRALLEDALQKRKLAVEPNEIQGEITRAAEYFGYVKQGQADVEAWLAKVLEEPGATYELYVRDTVWPTVALKKMVSGKVQITEEDFQRGFEANYGPRAEVLAIVTSNQRTAQEVWQMARDNPTDQFFGELAAQYSVEPTSRSNYGKVPPIRKNGGQPTMEKAAFALKPGELSGIIEISNQYVILRCQGFTKPVVQDLSEVRDELAKDLEERMTRRAILQEMDGLMADATIENFLDPKKSHYGPKASSSLLQAQQGKETKPRR